MSDQTLRQKNREIFLMLIGHLGRKEFDAFEALLAPDFVQEWPYLPLQSMTNELAGAGALRSVVERGMADFDDYAYRVAEIFDLLDPNCLIARYSSHSYYRPRQLAYSNDYISILRFKEGKLQRWVEYVNPLIIQDVLLNDAAKSINERYSSNQAFHGQS